MADIYKVVGSRYVLYLFLMALTGLVEAFSLASVVPLLAASGIGAQNGATPPATDAALTLFNALGVRPGPAALTVLVLVALLFSTALFLMQSHLGANLQTTYVYLWQQRLATGIFAANWPYFLRHRSGDLVNAIVTETQRLGGAFYQSGLLLTGIVHGALFLTVAASLSGVTTLVVCCGGSVLFLATRPLVRRAYRVGGGISAENSELQSLAGELISGAKLVKATSTERAAVGLVSGAAGRLRSHLFGNSFDVQVVKAIFDLGAAIIAVAIVAGGRTVLGTDPAVTVVVLAIFVRLMPKLAGVQYSLQSLALSLPAVELLHAMAADAERAAEPRSEMPLPPALQSGPLAVSLRGVAISYGPLRAVSNVELDIPAGNCVALVGESGAGKSTLVDAILGLVPLAAGSIIINGVHLDALPVASLRRRVGYMGQETILYNASVRENIRWGRPDSTPLDVESSVQLAGADLFIARLPRGFETTIGNAGGLLSGGERQRLALARAALGNPGLLILDEATSALDSETERSVISAIAALRGETTVLIIAHRLSSTRVADIVCVMEGGRIVERGSWDDLMKTRGRFRQMWELQSTVEQSSNVQT